MPFSPLVFAALLATTPADSTAPPATAAADTGSARVVRRFDPVIVRARFADPLSTQTVHSSGRDRLRTLPIDDWREAAALQPGVVAREEVLHVRGGRAGESRVTLDGLAAGESFRGSALDVPLRAIADLALEPGPFEARQTGALAGTVTLRTFDPPDRPSFESVWVTGAGLDTHDDRVAARAGLPLAWPGWGVVGAAEVRLDDGAMPRLRTPLREDVLGMSLGPRATSALGAWLKLARGGEHGKGWLEVFGAHSRREPFDPQWTLDGWIGTDGLTDAPLFSPDSVAGWMRYKAGDHLDIEDDRRVRLDGGWSWLGRDRYLTLTAGWDRDLDVTSLDGSADRARAAGVTPASFGEGDAVGSSPFLVYGGDDPYYRERRSSKLETRLDAERRWTSGALLRAGGAFTYESVALWELDRATDAPNQSLDSLRAFEAYAPGAAAYVEGRWPYQGLLAQGGLRLQAFTAGPQAKRQSLPGSGAWLLTLSPRLGVAFPVSDRDVMSFVYAHLREDPARDFLYDSRTTNTNGRPLGDPSLVPPTAIHLEVALKHVVDERWAVQTSLFQREGFDLIGIRLADPHDPSSAPIYANVDDAHAIGLELRVTREQAGTSRLSFDYTWMRAYGTSSYEEGAPYGPQLGARVQPLAEVPLDWDMRHQFVFDGWWAAPHGLSLSWTTHVGSPLPWTPAERRTVATDPTLVNSRRLDWSELTTVAADWRPRRLHGVSLGLEVRNLFDGRAQDRVSVDGHPNPIINTYYDDYAAWRTETGKDGAAYWDDTRGGGRPGWVAVDDPRLRPAPRTLRFRIGAKW